MNSNKDGKYLYDSNGNFILDDNGKPMLSREHLRKLAVDIGNSTTKHGYLSFSDGHAGSKVGAVAHDVSVDVQKLMESFVGMPNNAIVQDMIQDHMAREMASGLDRGLHKIITDSMDEDFVTMERAEPKPTISDAQLLHLFKQRFGRDRMLHEFIQDMGLQSTNAAISRVVDCINATCQPSYAGFDTSDYDDADIEKILTVRQNNVEQQMQDLVDELNQLMVVAKARLIYVDFPETATISIQLGMTFDEKVDSERLQQMEQIIIERKPKGLMEIEVSLTNKVVY